MGFRDSPRSKARKQFAYNNVVCIRNMAKDGRKILYFEQGHKKKNLVEDDALQRNYIRLVVLPDGTQRFEEHYSVRGSRISRSYQGNFNFAIMPISNANEADIDHSASLSMEAADIESSCGASSESEGPIELWDFPSDGNALDMIVYLLMFPMSLCMFYSVVDVQKEANKKYWFCSFSMCILWIAGLSYVMVWMASEIGIAASIPEPIMGVSSSIGSNIFDILFGLPFPWLIKTAIVSPGTYVFIESDGMTIMVLSLFLMVAFVILSIQQFHWKLSKKLAYVFAVLYLLFVVEALLIEYGVIFS